MDTIIKVENLSKKYIIGHKQLSGKKTFRDAITQNIGDFKSKFIHPFSKNFSSDSPLEEFWALKGINFEVKQGERIGIIGRNGAGKSTLLKILSRITEPSTGKITINGRVASLLEVGTGFNGELSGRENIFLNGAILGMHRAEIKQKFDEIVDFSGVEKFLDTPVKRYSSGMYVRLAFAVAAHLDPEILIVDEVLSVGDAEFQKKCLGKMEVVSKAEGRTVLFVSHNMGAVQKLCYNSILLENGKIISTGGSNEVIDFYLNQANASSSEYIFSNVRESEKVAYATKFSLEDVNGKAISEIPIGKVWRVKIYFTVNYLVENLIIGLGMINMFETPIRTSWNIPLILEKGKYIAVFEENKIFFAPGRYRLLIGISKGKEIIQYIDKDIWFTILDIIEEQETSVINHNSGLLINQMKMYVEKDY